MLGWDLCVDVAMRICLHVGLKMRVGDLVGFRGDFVEIATRVSSLPRLSFSDQIRIYI